MPEQEKPKIKFDFIILIVLLLVIIAVVVSYIRYFVRLDYDIYLLTDCDPVVEICTTDEETNYSKFIVNARTLQDYCGEKQDDSCILNLYAQGLAEKKSCEENLEDWEFCTSVESPVEPEENIEATSTANE